MVLFLYRPEYYGITEDEFGNTIQGLTEIIIAKHRNGSLDNVHLQFIGKYTKFLDYDNTALHTPNEDFATVIRASKANNPSPINDPF